MFFFDHIEPNKLAIQPSGIGIKLYKPSIFLIKRVRHFTNKWVMGARNLILRAELDILRTTVEVEPTTEIQATTCWYVYPTQELGFKQHTWVKRYQAPMMNHVKT